MGKTKFYLLIGAFLKGVFMKTLVMFSGRNAIDNEKLRHLLVRIPDVIQVLRSAQDIFDKEFGSDVDLIGFVSSADEDYFKRPKLQSLCSLLVHIGVFKRLKKFNSKIDYLLGTENVKVALDLVEGRISMHDLVKGSEYAQQITSQSHPSSEPKLLGISLEEFKAFDVTSEDYKIEELKSQTVDAHKLLEEMIMNYPITHVIKLTSMFDKPCVTVNPIQSVSYTSSLEIDPVLSWLWNQAAS